MLFLCYFQFFENFLDMYEMKAAMRQFGKSCSDEEIENLIRNLDENRDGVISFREFVVGIGPWFLQASQSYRMEDEVILSKLHLFKFNFTVLCKFSKALRLLTF
jgi:hypothetical protein